ncbi:Type I restriction-modification system, specificity subunit S [Pectobacterium sp. F1-1]|uniref:restriction endonuclease subunit S n=1 Tax=Pectobacterium sp. F1-1 TaxID=2949614 RepID=UPI0021D7A71A|nr:restriction endonuclease subunit S [Pectobacterium sp. F1-1]UYA61108.1 Type I restriction-modification system, specificity subunit S [Pectobacterium sp. F1-1]
MRELPCGWVYACLPELISNDGIFVDGDWIESKDQDPTGDIRLIQLADIGDGRYLNKSNRFLTHSTAIELGCTFLKRGDVLIARMPDPLGRACLFPGDNKQSVTVVDVCVVRGREEHFDRSWLMHFINAPSFRADIHSLQSGSTRKRISRGNLSTLKLPVPPRAEQTRIVTKLEELLADLDAGVAELKTAQKKLFQYRQSLLKAAVEGTLTAEWRESNPPFESGSQLLERILLERRARWEAKQLAKFTEQGKKPPKDWQKKYPEPVQPDTTDLPQLPEGWVWASVEQIASDEQYSLAIGPFGSNLKVSDYRASGVPLVFVRNIRSGNYGGENTRFVSQVKANELSAHGVMPGDVIVTKMGEPPGDADVYPDDQPPAIITADCIKIRCCGELMNPLFLKIAINSNVGKRQIEPMTKGVAQKKVSLGRFSKLAVPVPPANEQSLIVRMVGEADNDAFVQLAAIDLSLKQCSAQRQNILRAAFSGQLVTQEPNDEPASVLLERIRIQLAEQAKQPKPRRTKNKKKELSTVTRKLVDVLTEASDWLPAQDAFQLCGIADSAQTEEVEMLYAELRVLDKDKRLLVDVVMDEEGRKIGDRLKLVG